MLEADLAYALRLGLNPEDLRALASRYAEAPVPGPSRHQTIYGNGSPANPDRGTDLLSKRGGPARVSPDAIDAVVREVLGTFDAIEALLPRARKGEEDRLVRTLDGFEPDRRRLQYALANPDADGVGQTLALTSWSGGRCRGPTVDRRPTGMPPDLTRTPWSPFAGNFQQLMNSHE